MENQSGPEASRSHRPSGETATNTPITLVNTPITLVRRHGSYAPAQRTRRLNDLMMFVGWLELFNALDFAANVWNSIPVPTFAKGLMITGGSLAILASFITMIDLRRSWRNIQLLRHERAFLHAELASAESEERSHHLHAWLSVNFRELGWEFVDRLLQDSIVGFAGLLVGVGTIIAIFGANPHIYEASNLLSGYVGNGIAAFYGIINTVWSVYLDLRARRHCRELMEFVSDPVVRKRARAVFRTHQTYAIVNAFNMVVAGAGSLISATMWWGYVILIPCIAASVFCNVLWRKRVGYDRIMAPFKAGATDDIYQSILDAIAAQENFKSDMPGAKFAQHPAESLVAYIIENDMLEDLCLVLVNDPITRKAVLSDNGSTVDINRDMLVSMDRKVLFEKFKACTDRVGYRRALDQERMLYELLGAYLDTVKSRSQIDLPTLEEKTVGQSSASVSATVVPATSSSDEPDPPRQEAEKDQPRPPTP